MLPMSALPPVSYAEEYKIPETQDRTDASSCAIAPEIWYRPESEEEQKLFFLDQLNVYTIKNVDASAAKFQFEQGASSKALNQLNAIKNLPDNWDSYGSPALTQELYVNAKKLIKLNAQEFIPMPDIIPVSGGGVQFEWQYADRELEIEISNSNRIEYLKVNEDESMQEDVIPIENMETEIPKLFKWLLSENDD